MFTAPPEETTELAVIIDGLQPVQVPVQPAGSPALVDDPVLRTTGRGGPATGSPCTCALVGPESADGTKKTVIRLPSDVLFAFGSAELTPAAQAAIAAVDDEIGSGGSGTVTIEGHTDASAATRTTRASPSAGRRRCAPRWSPCSVRPTSTSRSGSARASRWRPTPNRTAATTRTAGR